MHAYGDAKTGMERSLASIAPEEWLSIPAAMLETVNKPPMWASVGLRRVVGTTILFEGSTPNALRKREIAFALVLAVVGSNQCTGLCPVSMACWNRGGAWA